MMESQYDELIFSFVEFLFSVVIRLINACVTWGTLIVVFYLIFKHLLFKGDPDGWTEFATSIRDGIKDAAVAFKNAMPAIKETAKCWAEDKVRRLRE